MAYGIYGDKARNDNNHQVLLRYDIRKLNEYAGKVKFGDFYGEGPAKPLSKYFAYTGNTNWGVQNLAYDAETGKMFMAVYKGRKEIFPNYDMFVFDVAEKPVKRQLAGVRQDKASGDRIVGESGSRLLLQVRGDRNMSGRERVVLFRRAWQERCRKAVLQDPTLPLDR